MFKKFFLFSTAIILLFTLTVSPVLAEDFNLANNNEESLGFGDYGLNAITPAQSGTRLSAEYLLSSLAQDKRNQRVLGGTILTLTGGGIVVIGAVAFPDYYDGYSYVDLSPARIACYISGGIIGGLGLLTLAIPTLPEKEYSRVIKIKNPDEREQAAYSSLVTLAEKARFQRIVSGISSAGLCIYYLITPFTSTDDYYGYDTYSSMNLYYAASFGAAALYSFLVKSPEEAMLDRYTKSNSGSKLSYQNEDQESKACQIKIIPYNDGLSARLVFNY